jgi:hypothetical protein
MGMRLETSLPRVHLATGVIVKQFETLLQRFARSEMP